MDNSSSQPERREGLQYQPTVQDYLSDDSGNIKVFGFTDASMDTSKSTNISATAMIVSRGLSRNITTDSSFSNDSGYSSFSERIVSSVDSARGGYYAQMDNAHRRQQQPYGGDVPHFNQDPAVPSSLRFPYSTTSLQNYSSQKYLQNPYSTPFSQNYSLQQFSQNPYSTPSWQNYSSQQYPQNLYPTTSWQNYSSQQYPQNPYPTTSWQNYSSQQYPQNPYPTTSWQNYSSQRYPQNPYSTPYSRNYSSQQHSQGLFVPQPPLHGPLQATYGQHDYHASRSYLPAHVTSSGPLGYYNPTQMPSLHPPSVVVSQYDRRSEEIVPKPSFPSRPLITNQRRPPATQSEYLREKKQGKTDRTATVRAGIHSPRLETEFEKSSVSEKAESNSEKIPSDLCNGEQGQIGGFAVISPVDAPKSQLPASKDILSERRKALEAESAHSTPGVRHDAIIKISNSEHVNPTEAHEPQRARSSRNLVEGLSQISSVRDITVSRSAVKLLPEFVAVDQSLSSPSQHEELLSSAHTSAGKDDTEVNAMSQSRSSLDRSITESRTASNSANLVELQQYFSRKPSISSSDTHSTQKSSGDDAGSGGKHAEDFLKLYEDSEEDFDEPDIHMKSALDTAMSVVKGLLLRELLDCALPDAINSLGSPSSTSSRPKSNSARSSISSSDSSQNSDPQQTRSGKRTRESQGDPGDTDGDDSDKDKDRPKKKLGKDPPERPIHGRLKCPFFQRQPERYSKAACRGRGFADMAKLKDHIKRVHTQPLRCSRCWLEMRSEDTYSQHLQQEEACVKNAEPQDDRIRPQLLKRLDFKKSPYTKARNAEEKWSMMFSAIFPDDAVVPSPFEQHGMSPRLEQALSKALEEELSRELAPIIEPIMARIKGLIPAIINNCRLELMLFKRHPAAPEVQPGCLLY
ncbi:hypothetical protein FB567DRAFT_583720 [Paraphoma chrysanthemicola]|uniref:C2H2-type domain-containing protein n=1 Tax=Paraphoma chrysanthemicola TaxID=798071 RepID=A0A8K0VTH5_9PLEO|nr:hypothetical protein FB567DRAFT_583720 [Paraphoma chrysanthemicola]